MGTINYGTSDYITLGIRPYNSDDWLTDNEFVEHVKECCGEDVSESELLDAIYDDIQFCYECDYENAKTVIDKHDLEFFTIKIEYGYYAGVYLDIKYEGWEFDDFEDKKRAYNEVNEIKDMLEYIAGCGYVACYPSWCTQYEDYDGTMKEIASAVAEMKEEVRVTDVSKYAWRVYDNNGNNN